MKKEIRVGFVSSINYEKGMIRVTYPDMDDDVTQEIPVMTPFADEYFMPRVDDAVFVLHLSNGSEYAVVAGWWWDEEHPPHESGKGLYRKDFDREWGKAFMRYDAESGVLKIKAPKIELEVEQNVHANKEIVDDVDVIANGISLVNHIHPESVGTVTSKPQ